MKSLVVMSLIALVSCSVFAGTTQVGSADNSTPSNTDIILRQFGTAMKMWIR